MTTYRTELSQKIETLTKGFARKMFADLHSILADVQALEQEQNIDLAKARMMARAALREAKREAYEHVLSMMQDHYPLEDAIPAAIDALDAEEGESK